MSAGIELLKARFKKAALQVIISLQEIRFPAMEYDLKRQLVRSSTSTAANYRAACRAKSKADFVNKLKIVEEEADETIFWLEMLEELGCNIPKLQESKSEFNELLAITVASIKKAREH